MEIHHDLTKYGVTVVTSTSRLALIPAEYVGDEFMVRVVEFPGEGNSISVGGMYDATQEIPRQAGEAWVARRHQQSCFCVFLFLCLFFFGF